MQLKYKRYNGTKGMLLKETSYCLEAILLPTPEENELVNRYGRWSSQLWTLGDLDLDLDQEEYRKQAMKFSMADLVRGVRFEYTNFNNVIRTETLIVKAAKQLLATVEELATFDGTERVVEVDSQSVELVEAG